MAEFIFGGFGQFTKAGAGPVWDEERIVSKSAGAAFHGGDVSFDGSFEFGDDVSGFGESEDAAQACAAVMASRHVCSAGHRVHLRLARGWAAS